MTPWMVAAAVPVTLGALVPAMRFLRGRGVLKTRIGRCSRCSQRGPVMHVHLLKNTGMLIVRMTQTVECDLCSGCALRQGAAMTAHTAVLGWWGVISFVVSFAAVPSNLLQMWWALGMKSASETAADSLDGHREYALNLLATKDRETVVDVLVKQTGATPARVSTYLEKLRPAA
jgi:hypothetical protein